MSGAPDPFGAPAPRAVRGKGNGREYIDPAGIRRDRWDRPILPDPQTGEIRAWTSVTTLAGTLADRYALGQWQLRQVARGMGLRHDLAALAAATDPEDRATLQRIASDAMEAAGSSAGRNMGSALHEATRAFDAGTTAERVRIVRAARPDVAADLKAYAQAMEAHQLRVEPHLMERMTLCRATESAGTADRFVLCPDEVYRVADLKTGQHADEYGFYEAAQQFAQYANGEALWRVTDAANGTGVWEPMPEPIDRTLGILIWLPAGQARCEILYVDLTKGAEAAGLARTVREQRKAAKSWVVPAPPPPPAAGAPEVLATLVDAVGEEIAAAHSANPVRAVMATALLDAADQAGVLDDRRPMAEVDAEIAAYERDDTASARQQFVDSGHAGCVECLAPNEDPAPWCDCRSGEPACKRPPCKQRAHAVESCPIRAAGGPDHYAAGRAQALHDAISRQDWPVVQAIADDPYAGPDDRNVARRAIAAGAPTGTYGPTDADRAASEAQLAAIGAQALDELLLMRVAGARDRAALMDMARQHAESWSPALQAAAAKRWEELPA